MFKGDPKYEDKVLIHKSYKFRQKIDSDNPLL